MSKKIITFNSFPYFYGLKHTVAFLKSWFNKHIASAYNKASPPLHPWLLNWIEYYKQLRLYPRQSRWIIIALVKDRRQSYVVQAWYEATVLAYSRCRYKTIACWLLLSLKDYYLDKSRLLFMPDSRTWMELLRILSKIILLGQNLWETALSLDRSIKTQRFTHPKRLTLYDEIYRPHPVTRIIKLNPSRWFVSNIDTGAALKDLDHTRVIQKNSGKANPEYLVFWRKGKELKFNTLILFWIVLKYL
jgi:hypothetical protein